MFLKKVPVCLALCLACSLLDAPLLAQSDTSATKNGTSVPVSGRVSGKLTDAAGAAVSYATVTLLRSDSSVINGDLSKDDGGFSIAPTGIGSFLLKIESLGAATRFIPVAISPDSLEKNMGKIKLTQEQTTLKHVEIVGEKPVVQLRVDKKVFNVEKNITSAGGSATDVLQNVPSVSVDVDGAISLRGKGGVTILIDGKPATMLGSDVASALQSMPASSIESVEVITNPSAKYDAQGTTGIINIITKKDGRLGVNGNLTLGAGTRDKYNGNLGLNARKGKWMAFMNTSYRLNNTFNNVTTDRTDRISSSGILHSYNTYEHVPRAFSGSFSSIGATFDPDKNNSFTLTENINFMGHMFKDFSDYNVYPNTTQSGPSIYHQDRYSYANGKPTSISSALDYKHKFKKKDEEINIDATFAVTNVTREQDYRTVTDSGGRVLPHFPVAQSAPSSGGNKSLNMWADYTNPLFTKNGKLGLGVKTQLFWFNSSNDPFIDSTDVPRVVDSSLLTRYDYSQQIHAAYINWSDQLEKFSYQLGLRGEVSEYVGNYEGIGKATLKNSFTNLFPSVFVSYQLPAQQSVYANYSRRVNRPNFFQLLPYFDLSNPSTVSTGNPDLIPEFINNIEVSYNKLDKKGNNIILSAYYQYTQNLVERITRPDSTIFTDRLLVKPENIASGSTFGLEGIANLKFTKIWDGSVNVNFFQNKLLIGNTNADFARYFSNNSGYGWFGKINTSVKLPANFSLQANANYESPKVIAQGTVRESYWIDLALRKNLWKNKATIVINCSDILKTRQFINVYNLSAYEQTINRVKETRIGNITFTYRFGKSDVGKNIATDGDRKGKMMGDSKRSKEENRKVNQPNSEDRGKNMKEGDDNSEQGGGNTGGQQGGGQKGK